MNPVTKCCSASVDKIYQNLNFMNIAIIIAVLIVTCIVFHYNTRDIQLKIAYKGYGPQDYIAQKLYPENFKKDWPSGIIAYDHSLPMRAYYYFAKYFGINPSTTIYPYMFIQTLLFLLSVAFLTQTLFQNKFVTLISVIIIPVSNLAGLNLSRFGVGYASALGGPLFYGYSNAFRFFALAFFLKNKYIPCFIFLALSVYCHVNMGLFVLAFIGAYVLYKPSLFREKSFIAGVLIFLVMVVPHMFSIISNAAISSGGIPVDQWVKSTRIFCFHWYPITMKMFTENAHREFFPFLLLCFFFFVALRYQDVKNEKSVKIIICSMVCLIMTLIGIVFSDIYPIPFLIKMSLQRSTGLVTFFGVLYLIYYLIKKVETGNVFNAFLAVYSLLILVFAKPGIAVLPLFLLLYFDIKEERFGLIKISSGKIKIAKTFYYIVAILLLLFTLICIFQDKFKIAHSIFVHLWAPLQYFNPFIGYDFLLRGGGFKVYPVFTRLIVCATLCTGLVIILRFARKRVLNVLFIGIFTVGSLLGVWYLERDHYLRWHNRYAEIASSYLDVQLWAQKNTPQDSLFMPDPSHSYGWRDFSERSGFGNLREWGYCAIAYNPDYNVYQQGVNRMKEFGIDIEKITEEDLKDSKTFIYGQKLNNDVRSAYYNMSPNRLQRLCERYDIDYFVMNKRFLSASHQEALLEKFKSTYMNNYFIVFAVEKISKDLKTT